MKCPTCGDNTPDRWHRLASTSGMGAPDRPELPSPHPEIRDVAHLTHWIGFDWMACANKECGQLVIRGHDGWHQDEGGMWIQHTDTWFVYPRDRVRPVDPQVPEDLARDFIEAAAILDRSHRMSAVLARRILADLLEKYARLGDFKLSTRIDKFIADTTHPRRLRDNLHHLREAGDFSAHTQTDDQLESLDIDTDEAEWTLDVVERLFDYFIVEPERDRMLRKRMDAKIDKAGRKAIPPLPPDAEIPLEADREVSTEAQPSDREHPQGS